MLCDRYCSPPPYCGECPSCRAGIEKVNREVRERKALMTTTPNPSEVLARIEKFLAGVHGLSEMNVVRGLRKVIAGEETTFQNEVRLNVYGAPCGHTPPSHYPDGYGECKPCRYPDLYDEEDYDDESRW